nr:hypothetical protein [Prevotella sp.]
MVKRFFVLIASCILLFSMSSCTEEAEDISSINKQTIIVFMPWSGETMKTLLSNNISDIESAIVSNNGLSNSRLLVFFSNQSNQSSLYEITWTKNSGCTSNIIKEYNDESYLTTDGMAGIINLAKTTAPALNYAMIIGGHGTGWTYKSDWNNYPYNAKKLSKSLSADIMPQFTETRFLGNVSDLNYAFDVDFLASAIEKTGTKLQYLLLDNCYMANVETAYELKDATNFLIASTSEIQGYGMPYSTMWSSLCSSAPSYSSITSAYKTFYSSYTTNPYGTLSVIDCREMENLASVMKKINAKTTLADSLRDSVQVLDGFNKPIFYDLNSYVSNLNPSNSLSQEFSTALSSVIRSSVHTDSINSILYGTGVKYIKIKTFSGITISDLSNNSVAIRGLSKTKWYSATH